jgi:transcriptional regulator with XRE-family HTH domain
MRDLGAAVGITAQAVKKYEDDKSMPTSKRLIDLCEALDVSLEWLLAGEPLDFHSTETAPQGKHAKYWVREAIAELKEAGGL